MSISVTITKDNEQFSISVDQDSGAPDNEAPQSAPIDPSAPVDPNAPAPQADPDAAQDSAQPTPVKSLDQALQLASVILSRHTDGGQSPFDKGMASSMPTRQGM